MHTRSNAYLRYTVLGFLVLFLYLFQVTPRLLPSIGGVLPVPLVPLTIVIAMREYEGAGAAFGLVCGLLMDITSASSMGSHAILLLLLGFFSSLLVNSLLNDTLRTALLLGATGTAIYCITHWIVTCVLSGLQGTVGFLFHRYLPVFVYTLIFLIPLYYFVGWIEHRMRTDK